MHILSRAQFILVFQGMINSVDDLKELMSNTIFSLDSTAFKTGKIVSCLDPIVTNSTLEPLNKVTKPNRVKV